MAEIREELKKALIELRKNKERKFNETLDLIVNLQKFDVKRNSINIFTKLPFSVKEKKICGFLEEKNSAVDVVTPEQFKKYATNKLEVKKLVSKYDFFIAQASVMPKVATTFGRALGPTGKMPSPQLGILMDVNDKTVKELKEKINSSVKIRTKEASVKMAIGKKDMKDEDLIENIMTVYKTLIKELPRDKENIKNVEIKFTMTKPIKIQIR
jgi:large subunit ribosomal protein L1